MCYHYGVNTNIEYLFRYMKKQSLIRFVAVGLFALVFQICGSTVFAQTSFPEQIDFFRSDITLNKDATITVVETINYDFKQPERHGIYRDIRLSKVVGSLRKLEISNAIEVRDENGKQYQSTIENGNPLRVRVGDPDVTIRGKHTYKINYEAKNAIGYFDDRDELYWNVTGNEWDVPITAAEAHIYVPGDRTAKNFISSYCGLAGSTSPCVALPPIYNQATDTTEFIFTSPQETPFYRTAGMTIAVGFEKGILASPTQWDRILNWLNNHWFYPVPLIVVALWFAKPFKRWLHRRKFYQNNPLVVEYDASGFDPLQTAGILRGGIVGKDLSAEIIYLATQGYLVIKKTDDVYSFEGTGKNTDGLNHYDRVLLDGISGRTEIELTNTFYVTAETICADVGEVLETEGLIEPRKMKMNFKAGFKGISFFLALFLAVNPGIFIWFLAGWKFGFIFSVSCVLIGILYLFFPSRKGNLTDSGLEAERKLLGLRHYISVAEQERITFHNAPAKNPEAFEKLLPYAMIFGLEKQWGKEFEGIYTVPPQWYSDSSMSHFSAAAFGSSLGRFSATSSSAMFSSPSSSSSGGGSSGGGSSGGGGGGGGGGSW